jgi:hypothetical protein
MTETTMQKEQIITNLNAMLDAAERFAAKRANPKKTGVERKTCKEVTFLIGTQEEFEKGRQAEAAGHFAMTSSFPFCDGPVTVFENEAQAIAVVDRGDFRATATPETDRHGKPTIRWRLLFMVEAPAA